LISCSNTEDTVFNYIIGIADEDNISILPKNMTILSKMLGISRASLYRSLDDLEKNGYISRQENKVKVINYEKNC
jgi:DNA-binding MarR family transcriptional regulator